jgi:protein-tyrosine phosphatase
MSTSAHSAHTTRITPHITRPKTHVRLAQQFNGRFNGIEIKCPLAVIDIHSHILPEIDDGSRSFEESLKMAEIAAADGIEQMVATPHVFRGLSADPQTTEILDSIAALRDSLNGLLAILPGSEAHVTHDMAEQVKAHRVTTINQCNYLLVEFPQLTLPLGVHEIFYQLQLEGVHPILVHPERNVQIQRQPSVVAEYVNHGVFIQVTAMSVTGEFGNAAKACAETLLEHRCVHFLATDAHRPTKRPPVLSRGRDAAARIIGDEAARRLVYENPLAVIEGRPLNVESPVPFETRRQSLFSRLFHGSH